MSETNDDYKTIAMQQAIYMAGEIELDSKPVEVKIAARANIIFKLFLAMTTSHQTTAEEIKRLIESN